MRSLLLGSFSLVDSFFSLHSHTTLLTKPIPAHAECAAAAFQSSYYEPQFKKNEAMKPVRWQLFTCGSNVITA